MPHPPSPASTTVASAAPPAAQPHSTTPTAKRRGNPNLALVLRCGARTRAGCPCRAPAIHGKLRGRMHGGRSTGPRTTEGRARIAAARTTHGDYNAMSRAFNRHHVTFLRRSPIRMFAVIHCDRLPPELAARMNPLAPELEIPPRPTCGISRAEDRALLLAETEALAPWKQAMEQARQVRRADRAARAAASRALTAGQATPLVAEQAAVAFASAPAASPTALVPVRSEAHAPIPPATTRVAPYQVPGSRNAPVVAKPLAPIQPALAQTAPLQVPGCTGAHAPARVAPDHAPASVPATQAAKPHASEAPGRGPSSAQAPARLALPATRHAPEHIPMTQDRSRTVPVGRAARRWLRQQKVMHRNQAAGTRP